MCTENRRFARILVLIKSRNFFSVLAVLKSVQAAPIDFARDLPPIEKVVGVWRQNGLTEMTIQYYRNWVRRFLSYCSRPRISPAAILVASEVKKFAALYARQHRFNAGAGLWALQNAEGDPPENRSQNRLAATTCGGPEFGSLLETQPTVGCSHARDFRWLFSPSRTIDFLRRQQRDPTPCCQGGGGGPDSGRPHLSAQPRLAANRATGATSSLEQPSRPPRPPFTILLRACGD